MAQTQFYVLSRTYPFFRAPDDLTALAELLALFGTKAVVAVAEGYGKRLICSEQVPGQDLQLLCQKLAERKPSEDKNPEPGSSQGMIDFTLTKIHHTKKIRLNLRH